MDGFPEVIRRKYAEGAIRWDACHLGKGYSPKFIGINCLFIALWYMYRIYIDLHYFI